MKVKRTKRLTLDRALKVLQLRYGTQVKTVIKEGKQFVVDSILRNIRTFSREDILKIEDELYSSYCF